MSIAQKQWVWSVATAANRVRKEHDFIRRLVPLQLHMGPAHKVKHPILNEWYVVLFCMRPCSTP